MLLDTTSDSGREGAEREALCLHTQSRSVSPWWARLPSGEGMSHAEWQRKDRKDREWGKLATAALLASCFYDIWVKQSLPLAEGWRKKKSPKLKNLVLFWF